MNMTSMQLEEAQIQAAKQKRFPFIQFVAPLENEFREYRHQRLLRRVPTIGFAALSIFLIFAILDVYTLPEAAYTITTAIRLFIICPLIGLAIFASYQNWSVRAYSWYCVCAYVISGLCIIAIIYAARTNDFLLPYDGILLYLVFGYFLMGLPFTLATFGALFVSITYFVVEFKLNTPTEQLTSNAFFIITLNGMGSMGSYMQERSRRLLFLNEKLVELAKAKDQKEIGAKTRLVATASHDLRQPLHAMNLLAETLEDQLNPGVELALTRKLKESIRQLSRLLSSLLNISRLNAGIVEPKQHTLNLAKVMKSLIEDQQIRAEQLGIELSYQGKSPCMAHSDVILLERIFRNLCENAFEHAHARKIKINWSEQNDQIKVEIIDDGQGIPETDIPRIFDEFHQLGDKHKSGMGLGLAIVKQLCELLDLSYGVDSIEGKGTRFWFSLKKGYGVEKPLHPSGEIYPGIKPSSECRILLVDDEKEILSSMTHLLENWGYQVHSAAEPNEAMVIAKKIQPDLLISDYRFTNASLNGLDLIRTIRKKVSANLPAILITADTDNDVMSSIDQYFDDNDKIITQVAFKPLRPAKLKLIIHHYLDKLSTDET